MTTTNYFKTSRGKHDFFFFFDERDQNAALSAWNDALDSDLTPVSLYRPFRGEGPWFGCELVGYASPSRIVAQAPSETDSLERSKLAEKLMSTEEALAKAWREIPFSGS